MVLEARQGNLISFQDSCIVRETYDLSYRDTTIKNSLSGTDGVREFMVFYRAFPASFTPEKQAELLSFLPEDASKKCDDFILSMVRYHPESGNWIFEIIDLMDFSYHIYHNDRLVVKFDSYYQSEWLAFDTELSPDGQHIITRVFPREADESPITHPLRAKLAAIIGYYRDDIKIAEHGVRYDEIENILKNIP